MDELKRRLGELLTEWKNRVPALRKTRLIFESGRYLMARAGLYLTRVVDVKTSHGKIFAVTDGGMNQNAAGAGIGRVMREDVPVLVLRQEEAGADCQPVTIVGPSCTPVDILHSGLPVAAIETGDIVAVPQAGAYGLALSPIYFCGHPTPAEVLVSEDEIRLIRRRGTLEELLWNTDV